MINRGYVFTVPWQVEWQEWDFDATPGPTDALIETHSSVISAGTDVSIYNGSHRNIANPAAPWPKYPHRPGGHASGTVVAVGADATDVRPGDRVVTMSAGYCRYNMIDTAKANWAKLPDGVSFEEAPLASHATVPMNGLRLAKLALGENLAVFGLGLIGQYTVQLAKICGADKVVAVDLHGRRRAVGAAHGADLVLDPADGDVAAAIASSCPGGVEVVIEATGDPAAIPSCLRAAASFGRVVLLGSPRADVELDVYNDLHRKGLAVIGSNPAPEAANPLFPWTRARNLTLALSLVAQGRLRLKDLISHRVAADESLGIWEQLARRQQDFVGVIVNWA